MKRLTLFFIVLLTTALANAQGFNAFQQTTFVSVTSAQALVENTVIGFHQISWTVSGTVATCTVAVDSSVDGNSFTAGGIIAGQTCTSNGNSIVTTGSANFVRVNMTALSGAGATVVVTYKGWVQNPSGGGGTPGSPVNSVQYNSAGSFAGTSGLTVDAVGNMTLAQGTITTSTPFRSHTVTWNAAGVAFTNWLSNITCTAAATASIAAGFGTAGTQWQFKYGAANCANPQFILPNGIGSAPALVFAADTGTGFTSSGAGVLNFANGSNQQFTFNGTSFRGASNGVFGFTNASNNSTSAADTGLSRDAAGVVDVGTGAAASSAGVLKAAAYRGGGAAATLTGTGACATFSGQVGGSSTGQATCASATAASTLTITPGTTAPNGWVCYVQDETNRANLFQQTSHTTTACTLTITSVTQNDVFVFTAFQY